MKLNLAYKKRNTEGLQKNNTLVKPEMKESKAGTEMEEKACDMFCDMSHLHLNEDFYFTQPIK